jgi:septum site-determining protein MinC
MDKVLLKGNKDGIVAYINSDDYEEVKGELIGKIERGGDFFTGCRLSIVDKEGNIPEERQKALEKLLIEKYNIAVSFIKKKVESPKSKVFQGIEEGNTKFITNTVRSGQNMAFKGNLVVIGDVNSGSEVIAEGNIVVLGVLRGVAHAGSSGNRDAFVAAYSLQPSQLRIAELIARAPDEYEADKPKVPEVARIMDNMIVVEPYLPNKYV